MLEAFGAEHGLEVLTNYQFLGESKGFLDAVEAKAERLAEAADQEATSIFNAPVDQMSYLRRPAHPFVYLCPDEYFSWNPSKFEKMYRPKVLHAPSSPMIKGTQIVRAAVAELREAGYQFEYVELVGVPHDQVLDALRDAHIVLNEFYAFVPGMFGVEAMATHCALLTSGDRNQEPSLAEGANDAWMPTKYWQVFRNLRLVLEEPHRIQPLADSGYAWADRNCRLSTAGPRLRQTLQQDIQRAARSPAPLLGD
jgi:hypothetical protein